MGKYWLRYVNIFFTNAHIQCFGDNKILEIFFSSIYIKNYHNVFHPSFIVWIWLSHRPYGTYRDQTGKFLATNTQKKIEPSLIPR